jgi:hypothetical protein
LGWELIVALGDGSGGCNPPVPLRYGYLTKESLDFIDINPPSHAVIP